MSTRTGATIEDLYAVAGKAELVNGEIVRRPPTGDAPNYAASEIFVGLHAHAKQTRTRRAVTDNAGFVADLPHRKTFSPDAAFYTGPPAGMKFFPQPPVFAAEVRSAGDYGPTAEEAMARKRADYFAAGTLVVWDVDLRGDDVVRSYGAHDPARPRVFRRDELADAEPAAPGWRMPVDDLFE